MKAVYFLVSGLILSALTLSATIDRAHAQATCSCPAGFSYDPATKTCNSGYPSFTIIPLVCRPYLAIGQAAASLQQNSFSTVAGMLGNVRDRLQNVNTSSTTTSSISGYSPADFDQSFGLLGY